MNLHLMIIVASQRPESASLRCARFLERQALSSGFADCDILDLGKTPLPLWDTDLDSHEGHWSDMPDLRQRVQAAHAVILVTPEWHGMGTPAARTFSCCAPNMSWGTRLDCWQGYLRQTTGCIPLPSCA